MQLGRRPRRQAAYEAPEKPKPYEGAGPTPPGIISFWNDLFYANYFSRNSCRGTGWRTKGFIFSVLPRKTKKLGAPPSVPPSLQAGGGVGGKFYTKIYLNSTSENS